MPKAKARKKPGVSRSATANVRNTVISDGKILEKQTTARQTRQATSARTAGFQSMIMPGMVALGCWGMAFTFSVFSTDPNHLLFGGLAALMAIMWSVSFGIRLRKVLPRR